MITEVFDEERFFQTEQLFEASFPEANIAYHGTTQYYSLEIEKNGFVYGHRPIDPTIFTRTAFAVQNVDADLASRLNTIAGSQLRLSLTRKPRRALEYAIKTPGGQALGLIRSASNKVELPPIASNFLDQIDSCNGCIYAVDISTLLKKHISNEGGVLYVSTTVNPELIVGRVNLPSGQSFAKFQTADPIMDAYRNVLAKTSYCGGKS